MIQIPLIPVTIPNSKLTQYMINPDTGSAPALSSLPSFTTNNIDMVAYGGERGRSGIVIICCNRAVAPLKFLTYQQTVVPHPRFFSTCNLKMIDYSQSARLISIPRIPSLIPLESAKKTKHVTLAR